MELLTKLKHTKFVVAYKGQFESLSNRIRNLSDMHKLTCFMSGLKDEGWQSRCKGQEPWVRPMHWLNSRGLPSYCQEKFKT